MALFRNKFRNFFHDLPANLIKFLALFPAFGIRNERTDWVPDFDGKMRTQLVKEAGKTIQSYWHDQRTAHPDRSASAVPRDRRRCR